MDSLDIHGSIHGSMDVDVPLGSMDVDVTNIHGYPSSDFTESNISRDELVNLYQNKADMDRRGRGIRANKTI
jgi:hypothetical protein